MTFNFDYLRKRKLILKFNVHAEELNTFTFSLSSHPDGVYFKFLTLIL